MYLPLTQIQLILAIHSLATVFKEKKVAIKVVLAEYGLNGISLQSRAYR